tara:strand:+ start:352 stop:588 length:237 start_codon:yes stop_codon:yes gene_type:complete
VALPSKYFKYIVDIPKSILLPSVFVLCVFGGYAVNNSLFDVMVMFALGWFGYFLMRSDLQGVSLVVNRRPETVCSRKR